jgi:NAD(P)-dependent dehydrogenase (short-subunit alcohol dehydrogenase family)
MAETALVCGAGGALGGALVEMLTARGDQVIAVDRSAMVEAQADTRVRRERVDLTDATAVRELWQRLEAEGALPRWVVNAVGGFRAGSVAESSPDDLHFLEQINLETAWWSCREAARHLAAGGAIVNIGARAALSGGAGSAAYAVAKAAVVRLTEVLAAELAPRGVRVNAVLPSLIDTPANRETLPPAALAAAVAPAELARVVGFLLSEAASAVTGAIVPVYGLA